MLSSSREIDADVLIVGGGPVGLALACELGWRGVGTLLVEQAQEFGAAPLPRINLVNARSMEFCRRWGIADEIRYGGFPDDFPMDVLFATSLRGRRIARFEYPSMGEQRPHPASPVNRQRLPQHLLDPILRRAAQRFESVEARFGQRLDSWHERADSIEASMTRLADGAVSTVRARYLVACDGAHSTVREGAGIGLEGEAHLNFTLSIYFAAPRLWHRHPHGKAVMTLFVDRAGMWGNLTAIDGIKTWRLTVYGSADPATRARIDPDAMLRRAMGEPFEYELLGVFPWIRRAVVAERFRAGRVFLAGDSAHQLSPTGGFGMNTGFGEAVDLGWKLEAVLAGWGKERLLDSYERERRPIAAANVAEATANYRNLARLPACDWIEDDGPAADVRRAEFGREIYARTRAEWESWGVQFGYCYEGSPIVIPDGTTPPAIDPTVYTPNARPGARAPHAWLPDGRSTLDLFGRGFVLLAADGESDDLALAERAAAARAVPFAVHRLDPALAPLYQARRILVRPDGHVAWRGLRWDDERVLDVARGATSRLPRS